MEARWWGNPYCNRSAPWERYLCSVWIPCRATVKEECPHIINLFTGVQSKQNRSTGKTKSLCTAVGHMELSDTPYEMTSGVASPKPATKEQTKPVIRRRREIVFVIPWKWEMPGLRIHCYWHPSRIIYSTRSVEVEGAFAEIAAKRKAPIYTAILSSYFFVRLVFKILGLIYQYGLALINPLASATTLHKCHRIIGI